MKFLGVSGQWVGAWVCLVKRTLYYAVDNANVKSMDMRKARCIILQASNDSDSCPKTTDRGPIMLVDCPGAALYLKMWTTRETKVFNSNNSALNAYKLVNEKN